MASHFVGAAFLAVSAGQTLAILAITCAAIALSYLLGIDEGKHRGRREVREQLRQNGSEPGWFPGGHGQ